MLTFLNQFCLNSTPLLSILHVIVYEFMMFYKYRIERMKKMFF